MRNSLTSKWNEKDEIRCLIIFKKLQAANFLRGRQAGYCRELSRSTKLDPKNINSKVSDFKAATGVNFASNASGNAVKLYKKYGHLAILELEKLTD
jgi:hypothetical protein